ncbi:MAG: LEPR-XLL domain-containing protein, partial [Hyphomicrobiales bacterium]|nr:LEPR-XLL domain-containing protein [Hyphomicrobiales bacterium]
MRASAARIAPSIAPSPAGYRLRLDPLEPRLLLSADPAALALPALLPQQQDHDVLVRLAPEGASGPAAARQIEVVQRQRPEEVIARYEIGAISGLEIYGGAGADRVTIDLVSFAGSEAPTIAFFGAGGDDSVTILSADTLDWRRNADGSITIDGPVDARFHDVEALAGGAGTDRLHGGAGDTGWIIDGAGSGRVGDLRFAGFEDLIGAAGSHDIFTFEAGGTLAGAVHGGAGGFDTLVIRGGAVASLVSTATGPDSGSIRYGSQTVTYRGLEPVELDIAATSYTFNISDLTPGDDSLPTTTASIVRLVDIGTANDGWMLLDSVNGTFEDQKFRITGALETLTIRLSSGRDEITLQSLDTVFAGNLTVNALSSAYDPFATGGLLPGDNNLTKNSVIRVNGDISLPGRNLTLNADTIYVGTVLRHTETAGDWSGDKNAVFRDLRPVGADTGMRAALATDGDGRIVEAWVTVLGSGPRVVGDTIRFAHPGDSTRTITFKVENWGFSARVSDQSGAITLPASQTFRDLSPTSTSGAGAGMRVSVETDGAGARTIIVNDPGTGYAAGDLVRFDIAGQVLVLRVEAVSQSAVVSTQKAGGNAGNIWLGGIERTNPADGVKAGGGRVVALGPNAELRAEADTAGKKAGKITIAVSDTAFRAASWPFDFTSKDTRITIHGATLRGGNVELLATSSDLAIANDVNNVPPMMKGLTATATNLLSQIPGGLIGTLTGIDVSVIIREANAHVSLADATIVSTASVDVSASTKVNTEVYALAISGSPISDATGVEFAAGYGLAKSDVSALVVGTTNIEADLNVRIRASGEATARTVARASANLVSFTGQPADPNAVTIAIALAHSDLTATTRVMREATIWAKNGNVNAVAAGVTKATADGSTVGFIDGRGGLGAVLGLDISEVRAFLDGTISAGATVSGSGTTKPIDDIDRDLDLAKDTIRIADHGFRNGQLVTYTAQNRAGGFAPDPDKPAQIQGAVLVPGEAIGGLADKKSYYVIVIDKDTIQLAAAPPLDLDLTGANAGSDHKIEVPKTLFFDLDPIDAANDTVRLVDHGFSTGDVVRFTGTGPDSIGLVSGQDYTVEKIDDTLFRLMSGGTVVQLVAPLNGGTFTFTRNGAAREVVAGRVDAAGERILLRDHGFTGTTRVIYAPVSDDADNIIGGLANEREYLLEAIDAHSFRLRDAVTGAIIDLSNPAGPGGHALSFIGKTFVFKPTSAHVDADHDLFKLTGHGLADGQAIVYSAADTTVTRTIVQPPQPGETVGRTLNVSIQDPAIAGLEHGRTYWVVKVSDDTFRLVDDPALVKAVKAIDLTAKPSGIPAGSRAWHTLGDDTTLTDGVGVQASLKSDVRAVAKPEVGGKFNPSKYKDILSRGDVALAAFWQNASAQSGKMPKDQNGKELPIQNNSFSGAGAVGVTVGLHDVRAVIGDNATAADRTSIRSQGNVEVNASIEQKTQIIAQSQVSKPKGSNGAAVSLSIAVAVFDNDANALIRGFSDVDAYGKVDLGAKTTYPFLIPPVQVLTGIPQDIADRGISAVTTLLDGTFGVGTKLLNTWVMSYGKAAESKAVAVSGSIAVNTYLNTTKAIVESGANINQLVDAAWSPGDKQSVALKATLDMQLIELAGIGKWSLSESPIGKGIYENKFGQLWAGGDVIDVFGRSSGKALGGSILVSIHENETKARIEGAAKVNTGAKGKLSLDATESIFRISMAQSGGKIDGGSFAFAGSALATRQRSDTQAGIVADAAAGPAIGGGGDLSISAKSGGFQLGLAGSIIVANVSPGSGSATGVGFAVIVNDIERATHAFIGADPTDRDGVDNEADLTPAGRVAVSAGSISLTSTLGGDHKYNDGIADRSYKSGLYSFVGTATVITSGPTPSKDNPVQGPKLPKQFGEDIHIDGTSGIGIAGSALVNVVRDTSKAYINASGTIIATRASVPSGDPRPVLGIEALNDQLIIGAAGGVSIAKAGGQSGAGGTTIGGAFVLNQISSTTRAAIANRLTPGTDPNGLTIITNGADDDRPHPQGKPYDSEVLLSAERTGLVFAFSAALSANLNTSGTSNADAFAGSVSINRLVDDTRAVIDGAAVTTHDATLRARNTADLYVIGGGGGGTAGAKGIGASIAYNQLAANTLAGVTGDVRRGALTARDGNAIAIEAVNDQSIRTFAVSVGASTGQGGTGAAFTIAINIIANGEEVFARGNAGRIEAAIRNADVIGGAISLKAQDDSVITAIAGALGIATNGSGYGAALGWNQIAVNVRTAIENATVTASGPVSLLAQSTEGDLTDLGRIGAAAIGAAGAGGQGNAVGASLAINGTYNTTEAVISAATVVANGAGNGIAVRAEDETTIRALTGGVAIATGGNGVGAALAGNYIANETKAHIIGATVSAGGDVDVAARSEAAIDTLTLGLGGGKDVAFGGSVSTSVITNTTRAQIEGASSVTSGDDLRVLATADNRSVTLAGGFAGGGKAAVGISITNVTIVNVTEAIVDGTATLRANGNDGIGITDITGATRSGVSIEARSGQEVVIVGVGGAVSSGTGAGAGALTVTYIDDTVRALIGDRTMAPAAGQGVFSNDDVNIVAMGDTVLVGVAGALAGGKAVGVGIGADAGVLKRRIEAAIGAMVRVEAEDDVVVQAIGGARQVSVSASAGFAGKGAGAASVGVTYFDLTTKAWIGRLAIVGADGNVLVSAEDRTDLDQIAGSVAGAGAGAVGIAAGVGILTKTTEAYIGEDASVTGLAAAGKAGILANTGGFTAPLGFTAPATPPAGGDRYIDLATDTFHIANHGLEIGDEVIYSSPSPLAGLQDKTKYVVIARTKDTFRLALAPAAPGLPAQPLAIGAGADAHAQPLLRRVDKQEEGGSADFATANVDYATDTITAPAHGLITGQEILYTAESTALGGLSGGGRYYVIRDGADTFRLAQTRDLAFAGTAIDLTERRDSRNAVVGTALDRHVVQSLNSTGVPVISNSELDDASVFADGLDTPARAVRQGVIVVAVSINDLTSAGVGVAIAGKGAGALAGGTMVHTIDTRAFIDRGARINADNTGAGANQDVIVAAGRTYDGLAIGAGLAGAGGFAAAPGIVV